MTMKNFFNSAWNVIIHLFWALFWYGQLIRAFDGILMFFGTRLSHAYSTWPDFSLSSILLSFMVLSVYLSRIVVKWLRMDWNSDFPQKPVDKT